MTLESNELDSVGMVMDYADLDDLFDWIRDSWDHRTINLGEDGELNSTAENMAEVIFWKARDLYGVVVKRVGVSETPKTWAYYYEQ